MAMKKTWVLLLSIKQDHFHFVMAELKALAEMVKIPAHHFSDADCALNNVRFNLKEDDDISEAKLREMCSRSISIYGLYELWEEGASYEEVHKNFRENDDTLRAPFYEKEFAFEIELIHRKKMTMPERIRKFDSFASCLPMRGKINLKKPECKITIIENYGVPKDNSPKGEYDLVYVTVGRFLCNGQRNLIVKYAVSNRVAVGNTSMDAELCLFMTNLAQARAGSLVFDPFCGTGSMLLTSAHFQSMVIGSDISWNVMMAKGKSARMGQENRKPNETLRGALEGFDLGDKCVDSLVIDNNINPWRRIDDGWFDAIITDPPYGVREKCEKVGTSKKFDDWIDFDGTHFPDKVAYNLNDVFADLMKFSNKHLRVGGKLVFWYPVSREELKKHGKLLYPRHSSFELFADCEQVLNMRTSRILLVYSKIKTQHSEDVDASGDVLSIQNGFRDIYFQPCPPGTKPEERKQWRPKQAEK